MSDKIIQRIGKDLAVPNLVELLCKLSGSDLHSLLLAVLKNRVAKVEPSKLTLNKVSKICNLDGRLLNEVERL